MEWILFALLGVGLACAIYVWKSKCPFCGKLFAKEVIGEFEPERKKRQEIVTQLRAITSEAEGKPNQEKERLLFERGEKLKQLADLEREIEDKKARGPITVSLQCRHCHCQWQEVKTIKEMGPFF